MLWLGLHLPLLSLEAFEALLAPEQRSGPVALLQDHRISAANAAAAQCGIKPGCKRATALALVPQLLFGQADAGRDAQALLAVARAALAFTPTVSLQPPSTVLLEVQASLRCFGGPAALLQRLRERLAPLGHALQIASAPTALGAALLARWQGNASVAGSGSASHGGSLAALQAALDVAPVWMLCADPEQAQAMHGMGLRTLAQLRQLPRSGLARRFGAGLLADLDRAYGSRPDPRASITLPPVFDSRLELFAHAETTEQVLQGAHVLLARLLAWAQAQHARVAAFTLVMLHETRLRGAPQAPACTELEIALAEPSGDAAHLQLLLRERLANVSLAAPALELRLRCRHLRHGAPPTGELFPTRASEHEGLTRLIERLRARLGDSQVQRVMAVPDHRPERASVLQPLQAALPRAEAARQQLPDAQGLAKRPVWLLPQPLALPERHWQPLFEGRPLQLLSGPERIEAGWWDGELAARDYFIAQAADGALVWVYRVRLSLSAPAQDPANVGWFLQGRFG
jgi:protein ImuB